MNARRTRFLRQSCDQLFNFLAGYHHQVRQFVNDHHNQRYRLQRLRCIGRETERVRQRLAAFLGFSDFCVVACKIAHTKRAHQLVAPLHFGNTPVERIGGLAHICDDRCEQVRDIGIDRHFEHLRVDQNQAHVFRFGFVE